MEAAQNGPGDLRKGYLFWGIGAPTGGGSCGVPSVTSAATAGLGFSLTWPGPAFWPASPTNHCGSPRNARASQPPAEWPTRTTWSEPDTAIASRTVSRTRNRYLYTQDT